MTLDAVVIGAGAAGIAAARALTARGRRVAIVEARPRVGGRAWTDRSLGFAFDRGAQWLHGVDDHPLRRFAGDDCAPWSPAERTHLGDRWATADEEAARAAAIAAAYQTAWHAARAGRDDALSTLLPTGRWADSWIQWLADDDGADPADLSAIDFERYDEPAGHAAIGGGLGALVAGLADGLDVTTACPVERVAWGGATARVTSARGTLEARAVIVAVPTPACAALRFDPPLPAWKLEAAAQLPLGARNKVALRFDRPVWPADQPLYVHAEGRRPHGMGLELGPDGGHAVLAHVGATRADELERAGADASVAAALDELVAVLGADLRRGLVAALATGWRSEPHIGGAYSHARPGCAGARALLAAPLDGRLFFAGEACSLAAYGTVHGAWASGIAAAAEVEAAR